MALPFTDNFNNGGIDQDIEVYNAAYVRKIDLTLTMQVHNNEVRCKVGNTSPAIGYGGGGSAYTANHGVEAKIAGSQVNYVSLGVRVDGDATLFNCQGYLWSVWAGVLQFLNVSGTPITLTGSPSVTVPSLGDICKFQVVGQELQCYINGSLVQSFTLSGEGPTGGGIPIFAAGAPISADGWDDATWYNVVEPDELAVLLGEPTLGGSVF